MNRPEVVTEQHLTFLDQLRESGETNMFGARPYLLAVFPELDKRDALDVLKYWAETFSERHQPPAPATAADGAEGAEAEAGWEGL